jgi:DNA-binding transcriptional regulator YhcF (GntR family)|tara:strand:+ start:1767 stop:2138 length:372 start_codon:yes stop_codon:yes gene_type:complete
MTPAQKNLNDRIVKFWADHKIGPSYRQLAFLTETAVSNVYKMVERLAERGIIHVDKGVWRGIYPIDEWRKKNEPERTYRDEYERKLLMENKRMREALEEIRDIADVSEGTELYVMIAEKGLGD